MKLIDPNTTYPFVPSSDRNLPEDQRCTLHVRQLPQRVSCLITDRQNPQMDAKTSKVTLRDKQGTLARDVARYAIQSADNLEITIETEKFGASWGQTVEGVKQDQIERIPWKAVMEVYEFVMDGCELSEDDQKNS